MIIKISARELRGLLSSGSVPQGGVPGFVTHPVGDGKTKCTMTTTGGGPCHVGADGSLHPYAADAAEAFPCGSGREIDKRRIETLESVADFNWRAFRRGAGVFAKDTTDWAKAKAEADREAVCSLYMESAEAQGDGRRHDRDRPAATPGMLRAMGFPTFCGEPVFAFPHDCPAAAFARGFSEAFRPWLDAFDSECREMVTDRFEDGRALCMEAYGKSCRTAYVRFSVHDGGSADGRRTVLGWCTYVPGWADVRPIVSREVDGAVRSLAVALPLSDADMSRVRDAVVRSGCGGVACPDGADECGGPMPEWERVERARSVARWMERWLGDFEGWFRKVELRRMSETGSSGPAGGMTIDAHPSRDGLRVRLMAHRGGCPDGPAVYDEERALPERDEDLQDWEADFIKALVDKVERAFPWCDVDGFLDGRSGPFDGDVSFRRHGDYNGDDDEDEDEGEAGKAGVTDAGGDDGVEKRLEGLSSALWKRLNMMSASVNHRLEGNDDGMEVVVNTVTGGTAVTVYVQVRNGKGGWTRGKCWSVDLSQVEGEDYDAVADTVVPEWSREVFRAVMRGDWGGWRGSSPACGREMCGMAEAAAEDYEQMDREAEEESRREMAEVEGEIAEDVGVRPAGAGIGGRRGDEADVQDYDFDDGGHDGIQCSGGIDPTAARTREAAVLLRGRLRRFCKWAGGETSRTLEAPVMLSSYRGDVVRSVIRDCKTRETLYDQVFPYCSGDPVETFVEYMRVMTENAVCRRLNLEPDGWTDGKCDEAGKTGDDEAGEKGKAVRFVRGPKSGYDPAAHAGCVYYADDMEELIVNGETYACKSFVSRRETKAHKAAEMIRVWLDGLDRWARARHKDRGCAHEYGMSFSVFPSAGGVRLMCHDTDHSFGRADEYAVYDRWCPLPDGADADATDYAVLMCVMMAGDLSDHEQWMEIEEFLRRVGATPFDARVLEALEGQDGQGCGEDGDGEDEDE